jgi:hypothetical protein
VRRDVPARIPVDGTDAHIDDPMIVVAPEEL